MLIDCIIKTWVKPKNSDNVKFFEIPIYELHYYDENHDIKHSIQIVHINREGESSKVLVEKEFIPDGKSIHYLYFCGVSYQYDESKKIIYTTDTLRNI